MADAFFAGAASNAMGNLVTEYSSPYVAYFFRYGRIRKDFRRLRKQLELRNGRVEHDVAEALRQTEIIEDDVLEWQKEAKEELRVTQSLANKVERYKCFRWCPTWGWRYCLSRKVAKKNIDISEILARSDFPRVGRPAPLEGTESSGLKDIKLPETSRLALKGILEGFKKDDVGILGVYGMPGVGKTTLAEEVKHQAKQNGFDKVVMFTVSQNPKINDIQDRVAEIFGLKFQTYTPEGRAEVLRRRLKDGRLKDEKNILIIADDVWDEINLQEFGIPFGGYEHNGIKVLLTTRREQVCIKMDCQDKFKVETLSEDEAWTLFKHNAGLKDDSNDVAKDVARECKGLPLAIVTIARTLKGASLDEWEIAHKRLKDSIPLDNPEVCKGIYECLEFSYDYLKVKNIQSCFLLCSLYPEDWDIRIESLTMCAIGQGLFCDIHQSIESLRGEIRVALKKLQNSGLLLESHDEESVKMHDVVRDFAHWITSRGENRFIVRDGTMEWPMIESLGCHTTISLWNSKISYFPNKLGFSKLKTLILTGKRWDSMEMEMYSLNVPWTFFEGMNVLQVLILENVVLNAEAFQFLKNLRTLAFEDCELSNVSFLEHLEYLEILVLVNTNIHELPKEVVALHRLKLLSFSNAARDNMDYFQPNLLSRLSSLQELSVARVNNVNLLELDSLSHLTALTLRVSSTESEPFPKDFVFPNLSRFYIAVNDSCAYEEDEAGWRQNSMRTLRITNDFMSSSLDACRKLFRNVESLTLEMMAKLKNVVPDLVDHGGLNDQLTSLKLEALEDMECLIDSTQQQVGVPDTVVFSNLVELRIKRMRCFTDWYRGQPPVGFLQNLEKLEVMYCASSPTLGVISRLHTLKEVVFHGCQLLQTVFPKSGGLIQNEESRLLLNLEFLYLWGLPELDIIWEEPTQLGSLRTLKKVTVAYCEKLKYSIFPPCLAQTLCHLQEVGVFDCDELEELFVFDKHATTIKAEHQSPALANLTSLYLNSLPKLSCIWKRASNLVNLHSLKTIQIYSCEKLAYLFPPILAQTLEHLEELTVSNCESLEYLIMESEQDGHEIVQVPNRKPCCWPYLRTLKIIGCKTLKYVFPISMAQGLPCLELVEITDCLQLTQVFDMAKEKDGRDIELPKLQILTLENLENLMSFCPRKYCVMLPSLKEFKVSRLTRWEDQQGAKFSHMKLEENQTLPDLTLHMKSLPKLSCIWKGLTHLVNFRSLKTMEIWSCDKLAYLFSPALLHTLEHMEVLNIEGCHSLEHLISEAEEDGDKIVSRRDMCCWPKLKILKINNCEKLKYVFPITLAHGLPCLEWVGITYCGQLIQVFGMANEKDGSVSGDIVLPQLQFLGLEGLENLSSFGPTNYFVNLPSMKEFKVCRLTAFGYQQLDALHSITLEDVELYGFKEVLRNAKSLIVNRVVYKKNLIPNVDPEGLNELNFLILRDGKELEYLIDTTVDEGHVSSNAFNNLVELVIDGMNGLKLLCNGRYQKGILETLDKLSIYNCSEMICLSPALPNIREVKVSNCSKLQQVFQVDKIVQDSEENQTQLLSSLTHLALHSLPELQWIWEGAAAHYVNLQKLTILEISYCNRLQHLFSPSLAQSLVLLNQLKIDHCDGLEHIITRNIDGCLTDPLLPKLTTLYISDCPKLEYVFQIPSADEVLPQLQSIWITNSPQLKEIFNVAKQKNGVDCTIALPRLEELHLVKLINLSCFCSENYLVVLPSLKLIGAWDCPQFINFTIQKVVDVQVKVKDVQLHGFKELLCNAKSLTLNQVIYDKNLVPNVDPEGLNRLTSLVLNGGEELDCLIDTAKLGHVYTNAFINLVELVTLEMSGLKTLCNGQFPKGFLQKLEKLETRNCMEMVFLSPGLQNVKEVKVINCGQLQQVFQIEELLHHTEDTNEALFLSKLEFMELESLPELKWVWKGPTHYLSLQNLKVAYVSHCHNLKYLFSPSLAQSLVLLEHLRISHCNELENIIATELECGDEIASESSAHLRPLLLPKLTTLSIRHCLKLEYVFQIPLIDAFPQLQSIWIADSPQLKQVFNVAKENNGVDGLIALPQLRELHLVNLINLGLFSLENYPVALPSLEKLGVWGCPQLVNFIIQIEANEKVQLQELYLSDFGNDKGSETVNLQLRQSSVTLECIRVANCEKIFHIQDYLSRVVAEEQNLIQASTFQCLRVLNVSKCYGLKFLFSSILARNLSQLTDLVISNCDELKTIIEMDQTSSASSQEDHLEPAFFPSLRLVKIDGCNNLESLLPISFFHSYYSLENIVIHGASKLEQVFWYHGEANDVENDQKEIRFYYWKELRLLELPSLKSFASMSYKHFEFPTLESLEVRGCPKLNTSFSKDSLNSVHAITQVPQQIQNNTAEDFTTMKEMVNNDIFWHRQDCQDTLPLYVEEETEDNATVTSEAK